MARDATNGQYYEATIESISDDGDAQVVFEAYQNRGQSHVRDLKEHKVRVEVFASGSNKRPIRPNQKEYLKKKKQKKQARMAELEEEREKEKNKWLSFTNKSNKKTMVKTQSIFQSPVDPSGRVGIGTLKTKSEDPLPNNFQTARLDIHKRKM
jgi:survival-of-motor-neuron-related-splicing factor 30